MKSEKTKWAVKSAATGALMLALAVPTFGQSRDDYHRNDRYSNQDSRYDQNYRDNERVTAQGRVQSFTRERGGYRVVLEGRRESYWVPESYFRTRGRDLRTGVTLSLGGIFRGGLITVDAVSWPGEAGYGAGYGGGYRNMAIRGFVERVDYRRGYAQIRDERSGRLFDVSFRSDVRRAFRRGDFVELSGGWNNGTFQAVSIDVRTRR